MKKECVCCGKPFEAKCIETLNYAICESYDFEKVYDYDYRNRKLYSRFCSECLKKLEATAWFFNHRTDPTPKKLRKDLRKKIKELQESIGEFREMLGERKVLPVLSSYGDSQFLADRAKRRRDAKLTSEKL